MPNPKHLSVELTKGPQSGVVKSRALGVRLSGLNLAVLLNTDGPLLRIVQLNIFQLYDSVKAIYIQ